MHFPKDLTTEQFLFGKIVRRKIKILPVTVTGRNLQPTRFRKPIFQNWLENKEKEKEKQQSLI